MTSTEIPCFKYNYSFENKYQNKDKYFSTLTLTED